MKKKTLALVLVLALTLGAATVTLASASNTSGSIDYKPGSVIINPPGGETGKDCGCSCPDCCECDQDCDDDCDCGCPCDCNCGGDEGNYNNFFKTHEVKNDLYFGVHELTVFGTFDSANKAELLAEDEHYTTEDGKFTGVEVLNKTADLAKIGIEISPFMTGGVETLEGAELTLMSEAAIALGTTPGGYDQKTGVELTANAKLILEVNSGRQVKAAWYGILVTFAGTATTGKAQATLTWTDASGTL